MKRSILFLCHKLNIIMEKIINQVVHLTAQDFKEKVFNYETGKEWKYEGSLPAIVDFYADWCSPCKMVAPILEDLALEYSGKIMVYKVNTENEQELASVFGIQSIPTLLFIPKEGQPQAAMGALPRQTFEKVIQDVLLKN
jgi:thioredoxin 1